MKKMIVSVSLVAVALSGVAANPLSSPGVMQKASMTPKANGQVQVARPAPAPNGKRLSPEEMMERRRMANEKFMRKTGGYVIKPNSRIGTVAVIDTQMKVAGAEFEKVAKELSDQLKMNFTYVKAEKGAPEELLKNSKAKYAVIVTDDAAAPASLVALEDNWATMNVAKMGRGLKGDAVGKFLTSRCRKELSRLLAILCGGTASQFPGNVMDVKKLEDLDLAVEGLPFDKIRAMEEFLKYNGFQAEVRATYRKACQEGWAAQPTNEIQKAVWNEVYTMPDKPITIEKK